MKNDDIIIKFNHLIRDYKTIDENIFIGRLADVILEDNNFFSPKIKEIIENHSTGIHLKYLLIKTIGTLKKQKFLPLLSHLLIKEDKMRIITEILDSISKIITIESYKTIVKFFSLPENKDFLHRYNSYLKAYYSKSPLIYHFDVFYRERDDVSNIVISTNYLIENLDDAYLKDLLPTVFSEHRNISLESLRLFEKRPIFVFYKNIKEVFLNKKDIADLEYFKQIVRCLIETALLSPQKDRIFIDLKSHIYNLKLNKQPFYILYLLKLNSRDMSREAIPAYADLDIEEKRLFFKNLELDSYPIYESFIKDIFLREVNEKIILETLIILLNSKENDFIFKAMESYGTARKQNLINLIIETKKKNLSIYFIKFISPDEDDNILLSSLSYIFNDNPDEHLTIIEEILFSGVSNKIKQKIIRNIKNFNDSGIKSILNRILEKPYSKTLISFQKDFLLMLISIKDRNIFEKKLLTRLLDLILRMMEEIDGKNIVNYIFFFDSFDFADIEHRTLIVEELKMIQNTLINSPDNDNIVNMLYKLTKKIESKL